MSFWSRFRKAARDFVFDPHRNEYLAQLRSFGIDATPLKSGAPEESYSGGWWTRRQYGDSLGAIRLNGFPASIVNIRKQVTGAGGPGAVTLNYYAEYLVPDRRLKEKLRRLSVEVKYARTMEAYGNTIKAYWTGNDLSTRLIHRLNSDNYLKKNALLLLGDRMPFKITVKLKHKVWVIRSSAHTPPIRDLFVTYQAIAQHLLDTF